MPNLVINGGRQGNQVNQFATDYSPIWFPTSLGVKDVDTLPFQFLCLWLLSPSFKVDNQETKM